jgi:hypothetical protein
MAPRDEIRASERVIEAPESRDALLSFIGVTLSCGARATTVRRAELSRGACRCGPTRSPHRSPLIGMEGPTLLVRGLDCLDGTPLLDLKPERETFIPLAPPTPGDSDIGDGA